MFALTDLFSVAGRTALVTGGATGLGRICAEALLSAGARVLIASRKGEACEAAARELSAIGPCEGFAGTVASEAGVMALAEEVRGRTKALHILVNNAGGVQGQTHTPIDQVADADWDAVLDANLRTAFNCTRAAARLMKAARYGRIVNISSGAGRSVSLTGIQAYTSAKAGQIGFTRQMAHELGQHGITVNCIAPGFVLSNPTTQAQWDSYGADGRRALAERTATRRTGTPHDIARGVLFFAAPDAGWVSGQTISIDGGHSLF